VYVWVADVKPVKQCVLAELRCSGKKR